MVNNSITFIDVDTHKAFFEVAYIEHNREAMKNGSVLMNSKQSTLAAIT
jgi:hypothetical protein